MKNSLNSGSSEGDDMVFDLGGAVGSTSPLGFHSLKNWHRKGKLIGVDFIIDIEMNHATQMF